jgi:hypothetical protein
MPAPGGDIADDAPGPALSLGSIDRAGGCNYRDRCQVRLSRCEAERPGLQGLPTKGGLPASTRMAIRALTLHCARWCARSVPWNRGSDFLF